MSNLKAYVEQISDDFLSTFVVVSDNVLSNMMGLPGDFDEVRDIVKKYVPDANLKFEKQEVLEGPYDVYKVINIKED